jgi:hypothetical protein
MTIGLDLSYQQAMNQMAQVTANQMSQQQRDAFLNRPLSQGLGGILQSTPPSYISPFPPAMMGVAEREPAKEKQYNREMKALKKNVARATDLIIGGVVLSGIVIAAFIAFAGVKTAGITVLPSMGVLGLYFGIHKVVFAYHKRKFELDQATKAMLE